ncbi:glycoside hydrolase family 26 protein [Kibdelosporangium philippinense]|uniref:Glycoside hydrolase family 26 protein n=1 Tax=Kibdelosporangium philippinense TaxID=211113 RepID=A0ABS8ZCA0_9PSEU|nr:glycosyl hydrolase [Kibdelosporangium philippinense]MCE7005494.1 glycoside hydrolase family 26 protein [Kibdelosporangium philippinense]
MAEEIGRRRFIGAAAGAIALGAAGGIALSQQQWFGPEETAEQETKPVSADPAATADAQALLRWFKQLPTRDSRRVVVGQQIDDITAASYDHFVEALFKRTAKYPAMIGVMVRDAWTRSESRVLVDHWKRGGLITMDIHPTNPWNPSGGANSAWVKDPKATKPDLRTLLATSDSSPQRNVWRAQLEKMGDLVEELGQAGAVVLLRPLHEGNGSWFWWGQDMSSRKTFARDLYRDVFYYITQTRRLHNVLWVYSPGASWDGPALSYYPGDEYVDMVCPSRYDDDMYMLGERKGESPNDDYKDIVSTGKPLGFGECGPSTKLDGSWDARTIIKRIKENYPAMTYFHCWHGWENKIMELARDKYAEELMNDPWVITRDKVDWRPANAPTTTSPTRPTTTPPPPTTPKPPTTPANAVIRPQITR